MQPNPSLKRDRAKARGPLAPRWAAREMIQLAVVVVAFLMAPVALALDQSDVGVYAIVHVDGHVTNKVFRVLHPDGGWKVEDKRPDDSWEDVTCEAQCVLVESSPADVEHFLGKAPKGAHADCIHNTAFAICRATDEAKPSARQYLFVALTQEQPIVLRLAPQSSAEGWHDQNGNPAANTDDRKSVSGFGGWVIVTSDSDWKEKWETPSTTTPSFTPARNVPRGKPIFVLTFFANPQLTDEGKAQVMCDLDVIKPNGQSSTHQENVVCFKGTLKDPRLTYLSDPVIGFVGDPGDPPGEWLVRITLKDQVRHVAVPLKTSFVLLDK